MSETDDDLEVDEDDVACAFCGTEFSPRDPWLTFYEGRAGGNGPATQDRLLCGFCDHSMACAAWGAGVQDDTVQVVRDMAGLLNRFREVILMDVAAMLDERFNG